MAKEKSLIPGSASKLNTPQRMQVLAMMARGERYETIKRVILDKYNVSVSSGYLAEQKQTHADTIKEMELMILEAETSEAEQIRVKTLRQLGRKLDKLANDEVELENIEDEWRRGEIEDLAEYRRRKAGLLKVSISELSKISKDMYTQTGGKQGPNDLPTANGSGPAPDAKWVESLMLAVQRGDTIAMQQLIITPTQNV